MTLPFAEETYRVSQLCGEIRDFLGEAFASVWVAGEVQRLRPSGRGHLYFELVEKGEGDDVRASSTPSSGAPTTSGYAGCSPRPGSGSPRG